MPVYCAYHYLISMGDQHLYAAKNCDDPNEPEVTMMLPDEYDDSVLGCGDHTAPWCELIPEPSAEMLAPNQSFDSAETARVADDSKVIFSEDFRNEANESFRLMLIATDTGARNSLFPVAIPHNSVNEETATVNSGNPNYVERDGIRFQRPFSRA